MWANKKSSVANATDATKNSASYDTSETTTIGDDDVAKIKQDAEIAIKNDEKLSTNQSALSTNKGLIYGYTQNGEIYLTQKDLNTNTAAHEYAYMW